MDLKTIVKENTRIWADLERRLQGPPSPKTYSQYMAWLALHHEDRT